MGVTIWVVVAGILGSIAGIGIMFFGGDVSGAPVAFGIFAASVLGAIFLLARVHPVHRASRWMGRIRSMDLDLS